MTPLPLVRAVLQTFRRPVKMMTSCVSVKVVPGTGRIGMPARVCGTVTRSELATVPQKFAAQVGREELCTCWVCDSGR